MERNHILAGRNDLLGLGVTEKKGRQLVGMLQVPAAFVQLHQGQRFADHVRHAREGQVAAFGVGPLPFRRIAEKKPRCLFDLVGNLLDKVPRVKTKDVFLRANDELQAGFLLRHAGRHPGKFQLFDGNLRCVRNFRVYIRNDRPPVGLVGFVPTGRGLLPYLADRVKFFRERPAAAKKQRTAQRRRPSEKSFRHCCHLLPESGGKNPLLFIRRWTRGKRAAENGKIFFFGKKGSLLFAL